MPRRTRPTGYARLDPLTKERRRVDAALILSLVAIAIALFALVRR